MKEGEGEAYDYDYDYWGCEYECESEFPKFLFELRIYPHFSNGCPTSYVHLKTYVLM